MGKLGYLHRGLDLLIGVFAAIVLAPLMILTAAIVGLTSKGHILYRAPRVGKGGDQFTMFKFRTMPVGSESESKVTAPDDKRLLPGAKFIRAAKLDELPQLFNVLAGQMAIVGPRPEDPEIVEQLYGPSERESLAFRPGLTSPGSLWYYQEGEALLSTDDPLQNYVSVMRKKLAIDVDYFQNATPASDLLIIILTIQTILKTLLLNTSVYPRRAKNG
ncbi:sugar transferase [Ruegeria arenilitoris]|uniref:sugar transferase n=1 Tax=Ruegeria arenilitoris TaxID=1173585 RepID=UPI00147F6398|nr:sugar transferase [Ruegeria arenilitoris]